MTDLKLIALDAEDLAVISAHVQDAVFKISDLEWLPKEQRFVIVMNRFAWELDAAGAKTFQRRRACLHFDRVNRVRTHRLDRDRKDTVLELLAVNFVPGEAPTGDVELVFAGGAALRLSVECLEAQLADLGVAWGTKLKPVHRGA